MSSNPQTTAQPIATETQNIPQPLMVNRYVRRLNRTTLQVIAAAALFMSVTACNDFVADPFVPPTQSGALVQISDNVISPTNAEMLNYTDALQASSQSLLNGERSQQQLNAIAELWRNSKNCWEMSEAYAHGLMAENREATWVKQWPIDAQGIDALVAGEQTITKSVLNNSPLSFRGYHAVEYMLFRDGEVRSIADMTDRELEFLAHSTQQLNDELSNFCGIWTTRFADSYRNAGAFRSNAQFRSANAAICMTFNGIGELSSKIANTHLRQMANNNSHDTWPSTFSATTVEDVKHCLQGMKNIFQGNLQNNGRSAGLASWLGSQSQNTNARLQVQIVKAINAVDEIPQYFDNQSEWEQSVDKAREETAKIQYLIDEEVMPIFPGLQE